MLKLCWVDKIANEEVYQRVKKKNIILETNVKRVKLIGHLLRFFL